MAHRYAPSLRGPFPLLVLLLETIFILLFAFYVKLEESTVPEEPSIYPEFQDVNAVAFLGFGFLATFLVRYGFSGVGFTLLVGSCAVQWAVLMNGFLFSFYRGKILMSLRSLTQAQICAASSLIAMGAILGKTNPVHLLIMTLVEVTGFITNSWILQTFLLVQDLHGFMLFHVFGAFFGAMMSWVLFRRGLDPLHEKEKIHWRTGLFSMLGALFLWMFWPSFHSILIDPTLPDRKFSAIFSAYLSLAVSAVTAISISSLTSPRGKINMVHVQGAMLAGGVAIWPAVFVIFSPWAAMTIGLSAGIISTLGFRYLKPHLQVAFGCHDTCGVLSVHGLPGILGWMAVLIQESHSSHASWAWSISVIHICSLLITLCISVFLGGITGLLLKWKCWRPPQDRKCFDDQAFWEFEHLAVHN